MDNNLNNNVSLSKKQDEKINISTIFGIIIAIIVSLGITFYKTNNVFSKSKTPIEAYQVYLKGESIGLIRSDKELYDYINKMQKE